MTKARIKVEIQVGDNDPVEQQISWDITDGLHWSVLNSILHKSVKQVSRVVLTEIQDKLSKGEL